MSIRYDPDDKPELTPEMSKEAEQLRLHPINVICDEPSVEVGDPAGVTFLALTSFMPRHGDRIELGDGKICEVKRTYFKVLHRNDSTGRVQSIQLVPNVVAQVLTK